MPGIKAVLNSSFQCYFESMFGCVYRGGLGYPEALNTIKNAPEKLFYKGNLEASIFDNCLSVVGSRRMSSYGKVVTQKLIPPLVGVGITIVSGFMYGIDASAHLACVKSGGRTIAVMPCGIDHIYPQNQDDLYDAILENNGLVLSEYEGDQKPQIWMYPQRNRLVAGLSKATLVVEAGINSGSLITASYAQEYGRKIFAVPGSILSDNSLGIYHLIEEGAGIATSAFDIMDFYQFHYKKEAGIVPKNSLFSSLEGGLSLRPDILKLLSREPLTLDELVRETSGDFAFVSAELTLMLLDNCVYQEGDRYYVA